MLLRSRPRSHALVLALGLAPCAAAIALTAAPAIARADGPSAADKDTARKLLSDGNDAYAAHDYPKALEAFAGAHALMNLPTTGLGVMRSQEKLGLLVEARDTALAIGRITPRPSEPKAEEDARDEAARMAEALGSRIPTLEVVVDGVDDPLSYTVLVDGMQVPPAAARLPRKANPGQHQIVVHADGYFDAKAVVALAESQAAHVPVHLERDPSWTPPAKVVAPAAIAPPPKLVAPPPPPSPRGAHPLLWVGVATAGAGLVVGTVAGVDVLATKGDCVKSLTRRCPTAVANVSNVGFAVAGAGAILGVVGLALSFGHGDAPAKSASVSALIGPGWLGAEGSF